MVSVDKTIEKGGDESYEHKMKKVMNDMKARPSIRANKDWDLTDKVSREGQEIINEIMETAKSHKMYHSEELCHSSDLPMKRSQMNCGMNWYQYFEVYKEERNTTSKTAANSKNN